MTRRALFAFVAAGVLAAACSKADRNADSVRADTVAPAPSIAPPDTTPPAASSTPAQVPPAGKSTAAQVPAAGKSTAGRRPASRNDTPGILGRDSMVRMDPKNVTPIPIPPKARPDTSHLGYDRAIQPKRDKAHTLPTARPS